MIVFGLIEFYMSDVLHVDPVSWCVCGGGGGGGGVKSACGCPHRCVDDQSYRIFIIFMYPR